MLDIQRKPQQRAVARLTQYVAVRLLTLLCMVVISVFLTTIIANMGGYVDDVIRADTTFAVGMGIRDDEYAKTLTPEERAQYPEERVDAILEAQGMNQPFLVRTAGWVWRALTLDWGQSKMQRIFFGGQYTREVRAYILDRLPRTLLLFGLANLLLFFVSIAAALALTHAQGVGSPLLRWLDRLIALLSPLSAAPPWVYGILLTVFAFQFPALRFVTARFDTWPREFQWSYVPLILGHMLLPALSIFLSKFFQSVFAWRTFFLLHYNEDYVTLAKAKGIPRGMLERQYILRPTLPSVLTNFALLLTSLWQEVIVLEYFFSVEGIGRLFVHALAINDIPLILALVVVFAYLLAVTIFLLDIAYALVDLRVRIGGEKHLKVKTSRRVRWVLPRRTTWQLPTPAALVRSVRAVFQYLGHIGKDLVRYPSAIVGLSTITFLIGVAIYAVIAIPYNEAVALWRGDQRTVHGQPKNALPAWVNVFTREKLPLTIVFDSRTDPIERQITVISPEMTDITLTFPFEYPYDRFPQELVVYLYTPMVTRAPHISLNWHTPDGRDIRLGEMAARGETVYRFEHDERLLRRLDGVAPEEALFIDPSADVTTPAPLKGRYELRVSGLMFEEPAELEAEFMLYGQVYGLAGTDGRHRDLMTAVLWGTAAALAFGLLAAAGSTLCTMFLAAAGAWVGGWFDELLQRTTEVNIVLPFLPVSLMIFTLYSKSFWVLLGVVVLLSIFGSALKNYRAIFLQTKQALYIEAACAYGASDGRIIFNYLIPRVAPVAIPQLVILVPSYVFLESALAFLGLSDPNLPTWGKLVHPAFASNVFVGPYHLVLVPAIILLVTGLAFALVGYALERNLNPQLRENL
ncbi:MAG: ABC transporter permease subunit [Anaerolineae bacterium]